MTTNIERTANILIDWADSEGGLTAIDDDYGGDMTGAAEALADAGLLAPEMREPDNDPSPHYLDGVIVARFGNAEAFVSIEEYNNQEVTPDGEEVYIEVTHRAGNRTVHKTYGKYFNDPSFADAREEALDLLAALDWIEKNK